MEWTYRQLQLILYASQTLTSYGNITDSTISLLMLFALISPVSRYNNNAGVKNLYHIPLYSSTFIE